MRRRLIIAGAIPVVVVSLFFLGEFVADQIRLDRYRPVLERRLSHATGLEVQIRGDLGLDVFPRPHFEVNDVVAHSRAGRDSDPVVKVRTADLTLAWRGLLFGTPRIQSLKAADVELRIDSGASDLLDARQVEALEGHGGDDGAEFRIRAIRLQNLRLFYRGELGHVTSARFDVLELSTPKWEDPIAVVARGELDGGSFDLRGVLGPAPEGKSPRDTGKSSLGIEIFSLPFPTGQTPSGICLSFAAQYGMSS